MKVRSISSYKDYTQIDASVLDSFSGKPFASFLVLKTTPNTNGSLTITYKDIYNNTQTIMVNTGTRFSTTNIAGNEITNIIDNETEELPSVNDFSIILFN